MSAASRLAWASANRIHAAVDGDAQVLCAPHGQAAGWLWRMIMRSTLHQRVAELREEDKASLTPVERAALQGLAQLRPVTIHQKFIVADGNKAVFFQMG